MAKKNTPFTVKEHEQRVRLIREASESLKDYNDLLVETRELETNLKHQKVQQQKIIDLLKANKLKAIGNQLSQTEVDIKEQEIADLQEIINITERQVAVYKSSVQQVQVMALTFKDIGRQVKGLGKLILQQKGYLLEQQKAVKGTELSMGILSNQSKGFRNNIYKTSLTTTQIGVGTKELAEMQGTYSDNIGRGVQLSEEQLIAMSELAKGTVLGAEGAAEFVANMEHFNVSVEGSAGLIDDMLKTAHKMGVNSGKVIKNVQKNVRLLHSYNFKGGVKGLTKMAALATKFKFEMESIAGFADNLMTPEGAVEAAAKLQVLGGAWAKMGDPFELMYRSRNDMAGLTEDIIDATSATARFDAVTGDISIDPMELHRLREVSKVTGISVEEFSKMAKAKARFNAITSEVSSAFSEEDKEYISGLATWDDKKKEFVITTQVEDETVTESVNALRQITPQIIKSQLDYQQSLKQNAEEAMTFTERWDGLKNMFRSILLPGFEAFANALEHSIGDFHKWAVEDGLVDTLVSWGKWAGELAGGLVKFAADNPIKTLVGLGSAYLIGKAAQWYLRGVQLGVGFNTVAGGGFGRGGFSAGKGGGFSNMKRHAAGTVINGKNVGGQMYNAGGMSGMGRMGGMKMGAGMGAMVGVGMGMNEWSTNKESGMDSNENIWRTGMVGGGGILGGAAAGAALGSVVPVIGTAIGGLIGAYLGAKGGDLLGDAIYSDSGPSHMNDFISREGGNPVPFSKDDTVLGAKKGGPIDNLLNKATPGDNDSSFNTQTILSSNVGKGIKGNAVEDGKSVIPSNNKVSVEFKPLRIEGSLTLNSDGQVAEIDLDDPILMRDLSKVINEQLSKSISGGKISSNPVVVS